VRIGAHPLPDGRCEFVVWGPRVEGAELELLGSPPRTLPMQKTERGYWQVTAEDVPLDCAYRYRLNGSRSRPDPASRVQQEGVHGSSRFDDPHSFRWNDASWRGIELESMVMYELHVGTFTPEGTFEAIIPRLDELSAVGVNAIELMPVAQFPGERNWGYDGVYPFAVQYSYGGPQGLKHLVQECHARGMAVLLDVVYNHLGPEGNYLEEFGPYFTDRYRTPWGKAVNFDGPDSDEVRNFFIENALFWFECYHLDALRLDAVHGIYDMSAVPFLQELAQRVDAFSRTAGRRHYLIAESDLNDTRIIRPPELGGFGIDAQWCDDFHHSIHTLLAGDRSGYYEDFGSLEDLVKSFREGFVYSGQYSRYRRRRHGNSTTTCPTRRFVVSSQNHDQIGNRLLGDRLPSLVSFEAVKLAAAAVILSPHIPLFFMGEEYAEEAPFLYFVDHSDPQLLEAVRKGRREEFGAFRWEGEPPDPADAQTFLRSKLRWEERSSHKHKTVLEYYRQLLALRKEIPALAHPSLEHVEAVGFESARTVLLRRWWRRSHVVALFNFSKAASALEIPLPAGAWNIVLDSADTTWGGEGSSVPRVVRSGDRITLSPQSAVLYKKVRAS
jgi:maltooligosyltrehalose trehalohydrolase